MSEFAARIPQPREGEPLDDTCPWCGVGPVSGYDLNWLRAGHYTAVRYECALSDGMYINVSEGKGEYRGPDGYTELALLCTRTPAEVEAVCRDIVAEKEELNELCRCNGILGRTPGCSGQFGWPACDDGTVTRETQFRAILLDSMKDEPATQAGREIASMLHEIRNKVHA